MQSAVFNSVNVSCIATDAKGVIQIFNVGAERMLGYAAADVVNKITPPDLHDRQEVIARASALSLEFATPIAPGFEALVFNASRGIEDIYELTKVRKDGSRFPAVVSATELRAFPRLGRRSPQDPLAQSRRPTGYPNRCSIFTGNSRTRTPVAWCTAAVMAAAMPAKPISPISRAPSALISLSGKSTKCTSIGGTSTFTTTM